MEQVLEQWQAFLNTPGEDQPKRGAVNRNDSNNNNSSNGRGGARARGGGEDGAESEDGSTGGAATTRRMRLPYHALRPLRLACLCRLGTCRYDRLSAAYKERLHADFGRSPPSLQLRVLVGRMYSEGKVRSTVPKKGRCKWMYWLPSSGAGQPRRRVCKAAFMAVHGITEKRVRDVQLLWMRMRNSRGVSPTGDESDLDNEALAVVEAEDDVSEKPKRAKRTSAGHRRGRKILRETDSEDSSIAADAEDEAEDFSEGEAKKPKLMVSSTDRRLVRTTLTKVSATLTKVEMTKVAAESVPEGARPAEKDEEGVGGPDEGDDEDPPYMDISAFEPICSLEEDSENLVLSLPRGVFGDATEDDDT